MPYKGSDSNTQFNFNYRSIDWSTLSGANEARVIFHHHLKHTDTHPWAQAGPASDTKRSFPVMARRAWVMQLQSDKSKVKIQGCAETDSAVAVP